MTAMKNSSEDMFELVLQCPPLLIQWQYTSREHRCLVHIVNLGVNVAMFLDIFKLVS
jgi:hypothetical protein